MNKQKLFAICAIASAVIFTLSAVPAAADNLYAGIRFGNASLDYDNVKFVNPGRAAAGFASGDGRISDNGDQSGRSWSLILGRQLQSKPVRLELEYGNHQTEKFTSYWQPYPTFAQEVSIDSSYLMVNALYDFKLRPVTLFAGGGLGIARNKSSAKQINPAFRARPVGDFDENTDTNFAYALIVGASKAVSDKVDIELSYRYLDLGDANTGHSLFNSGGTGRSLGDEEFKGDLTSTQISLGVRFRF